MTEVKMFGKIDCANKVVYFRARCLSDGRSIAREGGITPRVVDKNSIRLDVT